MQIVKGIWAFLQDHILKMPIIYNFLVSVSCSPNTPIFYRILEWYLYILRFQKEILMSLAVCPQGTDQFVEYERASGWRYYSPLKPPWYCSSYALPAGGSCAGRFHRRSRTDAERARWCRNHVYTHARTPSISALCMIHSAREWDALCFNCHNIFHIQQHTV